MLHLFVNQYLFLQCITEFLHWNYHWVFLWFCRLYSDGLELGSDLWLPAVVLWNSASHVSTMLRSNLDLPIIRSLIFYSVPHSVKIDATFVPTNRHNLEQRAARTAYIFKNLQYDNKKCIRLLRPWRDAKHFSMSKTVINTSAGVDLSVCSLWI